MLKRLSFAYISFSAHMIGEVFSSHPESMIGLDYSTTGGQGWVPGFLPPRFLPFPSGDDPHDSHILNSLRADSPHLPLIQPI